MSNASAIVIVAIALLGVLFDAVAMSLGVTAGYLRTRQKGYSPPAAASCLLGAGAAGVAAAWAVIAPLSDEQSRKWFVLLIIFWSPVIVAAVTGALLVRMLPRRNRRVPGRRRPRFPFALAGLLLIAIPFAGAAWVVVTRPSQTLKVINLAALLGGYGAYLLFVSRRLKAQVPLSSIEKSDPRAPVLYLRPFSQESTYFVFGSESRYKKYVRGVQRFVRQPAARIGLRFDWFFEGAIAAQIGPFVALGNPEDWTPKEGASRDYVPDVDWRDHLERLARRSSCILMEVGGSANLRWELEYLRHEGLQEKLFVITRPQELARRPRNLRLWERYLEWVTGNSLPHWRDFALQLEACGYDVGTDPGPGAVVTFDPHGEAVVLTRRAELPEQYVEPIRAWLVQERGYPASELGAPVTSRDPTQASSRPRVLAKVRDSKMLGVLLGALILVLTFRDKIPFVRDWGVPGGRSWRTGHELYDSGQFEQAVPYLERAAVAGNAPAMTDLGFMYEKGRGGLPKDDIRAVEWYRKAANREAQAMVNLGVMYLDGRGNLPKDEVKALELFREAADAGSGNGAAAVAVMYEDGRGGLPRDPSLVREWYQKAADRGSELAADALKKLKAESNDGG